jgi:hypothetical protein
LFSCISPCFFIFSNFQTKITCSKGWEKVGKIFWKTCGKIEMQKKGYTKIILWVFALPASSPPVAQMPSFLSRGNHFCKFSQDDAFKIPILFYIVSVEKLLVFLQNLC